MLARNLVKTSWCKFKRRYCHKIQTVSNSNKNKNEVSKIRNIGIMAHIDAGKTTTTERMLYYSGSIRDMGEVHHGNTVTDYMEQERERGITIVSAAVTFNWKNFQFNLIDTPGHIDFTMGVEDSLSVLDGAVIILDASAGVEAQTTTVWRQADKFNIPRLVYVNKMDRADADFQMCLNSIQSKFQVITLPVQLPIKKNSKLIGITDVLTLEKMMFEEDKRSKAISRDKITEATDGYLWEEAQEQRRILTDKLSSIDDKLANIIIEQDSLDSISSQTLVESLRRCTIDGKGVPVLLGSSYKNIGVQPLMDAVIFYLPSPACHKNAELYSCFNTNMSARAFKIVHDKQRGPITFIRLYTGKITKKQKLYNIQQQKSETCARLYGAYADDYDEIDEINEGNIGGIAGLKYTVSGDLLTMSQSVAGRARSILEQRKDVKKSESDRLFAPTTIPDPVFFCSIEPPSLSFQSPLEIALQELEREDRSLRVTLDEETGQTILGGMGELHIEVIAQRIRSEYKIDVDLGPLQIAYKESIENKIKDTFVLRHNINSIKHNVSVTMSLIPNYTDDVKIIFDKTKENASNIAAVHPIVMDAVERGVKSALNNGPKLGCPVVNVGVKLHWLEIDRNTSSMIVSSAVSQCIRKMLNDAGIIILEPIMALEIVTPDRYIPEVIKDLGKRRSRIEEIIIRGEYKILRTLTPLSELLGYSTALRIITSGTGSFSSEFFKYEVVDSSEQQAVIKRMTGL